MYPAAFPNLHCHLEEHLAASSLARLSTADDITPGWAQIQHLYINNKDCYSISSPTAAFKLITQTPSLTNHILHFHTSHYKAKSDSFIKQLSVSSNRMFETSLKKKEKRGVLSLLWEMGKTSPLFCHQTASKTVLSHL